MLPWWVYIVTLVAAFIDFGNAVVNGKWCPILFDYWGLNPYGYGFPWLTLAAAITDFLFEWAVLLIIVEFLYDIWKHGQDK